MVVVNLMFEEYHSVYVMFFFNIILLKQVNEVVGEEADLMEICFFCLSSVLDLFVLYFLGRLRLPTLSSWK